jgi:hypothetical protein
MLDVADERAAGPVRGAGAPMPPLAAHAAARAESP